MNSFTILVKLAEQMYEDIKFITEANPTQVVDEDTARVYNSLLKEVRRAKPTNGIIQVFEEMSPRTLKYKDALVVVGQLYRILSLLDQSDLDIDDLIRRTSGENQKPPAEELKEQKQESLKAIDPSVSDEELYGTKSVKINDQGIVPFELD